MTRKISIPGARDARWANTEWRSATLKKLCSQHNLTTEKLAKMTGCSENTVRFWLTAHKTVIGAATLRSVMHELNSR